MSFTLIEVYADLIRFLKNDHFSELEFLERKLALLPGKGSKHASIYFHPTPKRSQMIRIGRANSEVYMCYNFRQDVVRMFPLSRAPPIQAFEVQ